jgi:phage regulator Rha-like protein
MYNQTEIKLIASVLKSIDSYLSLKQGEDGLNITKDSNEICLSVECIFNDDLMCFDPETSLASPNEFFTTISFVYAKIYVQGTNDWAAIFEMKPEVCTITYRKLNELEVKEGFADTYPELEAIKSLPDVSEPDWKKALSIFIKNISEVFEIVKREFS